MLSYVFNGLLCIIILKLLYVVLCFTLLSFIFSYVFSVLLF